MFYSYKGGTGKTTSLLNVAAILARMGQRVGMVDLDFEAPALGALCDIDTGNHDLLRLMAERPPVAEVERHGVAVNLAPDAQVHCLPASGDLELIGRCNWNDPDTGHYLHQVLKAFQTSLDLQHLLLDTRSGVSPQAASAVQGATYAVIACRLDRQSRLGAARLRTICQERRLAYSIVAHAVPLKNSKLAPTLIAFQAEVGQRPDVLIPYDPQLYFEETVIKTGKPAKPSAIYQAYASITQRIQGIL
jgi:MinD-like ATPase involved in chromosome partitioning or flagellar assembly